MDDERDTKYDVATKFNWEVINNVVKMLNGRCVDSNRKGKNNNK